MRKALCLIPALALLALASCGVIRPPKPPEPPPCPATCPLGSSCTDPAQGCQPIPPPGPVCAEGQGCGCWHWPPDSRTWLFACCVPSAPGGVINVVGGPAQCPQTPPPPTCPTCPEGQACTDPAVGCVPTTTPPPSTYCAPDPEDSRWKAVDGSTMSLWGEYSKVVAALPSSCGQISPDESAQIATLRRIAAKWKEMFGRCAEQAVDSVTAKRDDGDWEEWHAVYYGNGCTITTSNAYKGTWKCPGCTPGEPPPVEPPPSTSGCSAPVTPKVNRWGGPKAHNRVNDSTPLFYGRDTQRWDGTTITNYCADIGFPDRLHCPARSECPGYKCEERVVCEAIGVSGKVDGKPLWRSDGQVNLTDNPYQATCSSCTWLEVCAADGTFCSRCTIDANTGLCAAQ